MVNIDTLVESLLVKFAPKGDYEKRKLVFWYDHEYVVWDEKEDKPTKDLDEIIKRLKAKGIKFQVVNNNYFALKVQLEKEDTKSDFLLYSPGKEPDVYDNWLLDLQLYSTTFETGRISGVKSDFEIEGYSLDNFLDIHYDFFTSYARTEALKQFYQKDWGEDEFTIGFLAVIAKSKTLDLKEILRNIFKKGLDNEKNVYYRIINNIKLTDRFWGIMADTYGYKHSDMLAKLFLSFIFTHLAIKTRADLKNFKEYVNDKPNESEVFLNNWLVHSKDSPEYDSLIKDMLTIKGAELEKQLTAIITKLDVDQYNDAEAVDVLDKQIIRVILNAVSEGREDFDQYLSWINQRRTKHWFGVYENTFTALESAVNLFSLAKDLANEKLSDMDLKKLFTLYTEKYYGMDYHYRRFYYYLDKEKEIKKIKTELKDRVENLYQNNLIVTFNKAWDEAVSKISDTEWKLPMVPRQNSFFQKYVKPLHSKNDKDRVAVIISDGLRYESALGLQEVLNKETKGELSIASMLGVLPTVTRLGMASLLPHEKIDLKKEFLYIDSVSTEGIDNRNKILSTQYPDAVTLDFIKFDKMNRDEQRQAIKNKRIIYIYHNKIDVKGDKQTTEHDAFAAVEETKEDLVAMINRLAKSLNITNIIITADHGFIYTREILEAVDKLATSSFDKNSIVMNDKRFIITPQDVNIPNVQKFILGNTSDLSEKLFVYVPRGYLRFKFPGSGLNYVHGGCSPQECIIPVIQYRHRRRDRDLERDGVKHGKVNVVVINSKVKISSSPFVVQLFQTEKVTDKLFPRTVRVGLYDTDGKKISDEQMVIFNSTEDDPTKREFKVSLSISNEAQNGYYLLKVIDDDPDELTPDVIEPKQFELNIIIVDDF